MSPDERDQKINDIRRSQKIAEIRAAGMDPAQPGVEAIGSPDGSVPEKPQSLSDKFSAALTGYGQGATAGYMPQINGGIQALGNLAMGEPANYTKERDAEVARQQKTAQENPYLYHGAQIGGGVASSLLLPGGAAGNLSRAARLGKAAVGGAAIGAAQNPGDKEGVVDPLQMGEREKNAGIGSLFGLGGHALAEGMAELGPKIFNNLAETQAFKALGPYARSAYNAVMRGAKTPEEQAMLDLLPGKGVGNVKSVGRAALDNDLFGNGLPVGYQKIAENAAKAKGAAGENLGDVIGELSAAEKRLRAKYGPQAEAPIPNEPVEQSMVGGEPPPGTPLSLGPGGASPTPIPQRASSRPLLAEPPKAMVTSGERAPVRPANALEMSGETVGPRGRDVGGSETMPGQGAPPPNKWTVQSGLKRKQIADELRSELISPAHSDVSGVAKANSDLEDLIGNFENGGSDHIPLMEAELKKRAAGDFGAFDKKPGDRTTSEKFHNALSSKLKGGVEDYADVLDKEVNGPSAANFIGAKNNYGNLSVAEQISQKRYASELAKHFMAPALGGASGAALGASHGNDPLERVQNALLGMLGGAAGGYALRQGRMYSPQIIARTADAAGKLAPKAANFNPWILPAVATQNGDDNGKK